MTKFKIGNVRDLRASAAPIADVPATYQDALDALPDAFIVYDADDRVVAFNAKQLELFPSVADVLEVGMHFRDLLRAQIERGQIDAARGREEAWIEERVKEHLRADGTPREQIFADGRIMRLSEHRTPSGGIVAVRTDITDEKMAQLRLREGEERFRGFAEVSADWFWETDRDGRIVWEQENVQNSSGRSFEDIQGMTRQEIAGDVMAAADWEPYQQALDKRQDIKDFEYGFRIGDGSIAYVRINGRPYFDEAGNYVGHRGIASNVTERKLAEIARQETEKQYRELAQFNPDAFIIQVDGRVAFANEAACRMFGVASLEDFTGTDTLAIVHPDFREMMLQARNRVSAEGGNIPIWECRHVRLDGTTFPSEVINGPIEWQGRRGTMNIIRDVSGHKHTEIALRESESRFRAIAESSPIPLLITRRSDGEILYVNAQVETALGFAPEEMLGEKVGKFFCDPGIRKSRAESVGEDGYVDRQAVEMWRRDGTRVSTMHSLRSIIFDGEPAIVGAFMDITAQQKVEFDLRKAKEEAESANASKTQFLAVMSHELRTPLNAIIGFSELMSKEVFGPVGHERYSEYLEDIHQSGKHLLALISDILDLSRIEAGHLDVDAEEIELSDIVEECVRFVQGRATENNVLITTDVPTPCPVIFADRRQTKQMLLNLLTNGVKFTRPGTTVEIIVEESDSGGVQLRVHDQGPGIPQEALARVAEPFTRLESSHTSTAEGTGLGLAIVKRLIEVHGGVLQLESTEGRGTNAFVSFPKERTRAGAA
jgi:PAS domain S-box-containing protein